MTLNDRDLLFEMKNVIPEREREAIMRLTMCARRNCAICIYGHNRKRVTVKLLQSCLDRITENMNILAELASSAGTITEQRDYWKDKAVKMEAGA